MRLDDPQALSGSPCWPPSVVESGGSGPGLGTAVWSNGVSNEHPMFSVESCPTSWNVSGMGGWLGEEAGPCKIRGFPSLEESIR